MYFLFRPVCPSGFDNNIVYIGSLLDGTLSQLKLSIVRNLHNCLYCLKTNSVILHGVKLSEFSPAEAKDVSDAVFSGYPDKHVKSV